MAVRQARLRVALVLGIAAVVYAAQFPFLMGQADNSGTFGAFVLVNSAGSAAVWVYLRGLGVARGDVVQHGPDKRYLSARTRTGTRTVDLHELRSVSSRRIAITTVHSQKSLVVRDTAGARLILNEGPAWRSVKRALERPGRPAIAVGELARYDLGLSADDDGRSGALVLLGHVEVVAAVALGALLILVPGSL
ncbi:hypothetical protein [Yinghuangia soli]|uniref:Uncharacterized protein n=1 Tax=Yinghuangia soli TaxID=2908204 RepID=A0AA41Q1D6_9ACTN|nr:hypothetical protein [Yinghuangia soli]MCF2529160.1 hypothetical protein [Yinghuangia soli]